MDERENQAADFFEAMDRVKRAWKRVTSCGEISKSQFGTLMSIWHHGVQAARNGALSADEPISLSALVAVMNQSIPALSQRVRSLEDMGYVERVPDKNDRRVSGVRLTEEGKEILLLARGRLNGIMLQAINELGSENAEMLINLLSELAGAFEKIVDKQEDR